MFLSESLLESSVKLTSEFITPILSSTRGDREKTLKIDGMAFATIVTMQILIPVFVAVTSAVISVKLIDKTKSLEELTNELRALIGKKIVSAGEKKKEELTEIVVDSIGKFGASHEDARELVELIMAKIESEKNNSSRGEDGKT